MAKKMPSVRRSVSGEALPFRAGKKMAKKIGSATTVSPLQTIAKRK